MSWVSQMLGRAILASAAVLAVSAAEAQDRPNPFRNAKTWAFQLKNLDAAQQAKLAASPYDLLVIDSEDFPHDGGERALTCDEVNKLKTKPDGSKRMVIAYFSVGEAESYRYYWKPEWSKKKPSWVGKENKEWKENFVVKYWEPEWQHIVYGSPSSFVDRVLASCFDGFYIDRADAYYYMGNDDLAKRRMREFIIKLTQYMRQRKPDIGILVQNAEELLDNEPYIKAIDGIAKEDLLFGISYKEEHNKADDVTWSANLLKHAQAEGKKIFVIEYITRPAYIAEAKRELDKLGFVMYTGPRGLGEMIDPGYIDAKIAEARSGKTVAPAPAAKKAAH